MRGSVRAAYRARLHSRPIVFSGHLDSRLITEIAKDAGFRVQFEPMAFASLLSALTSTKIDIIGSNMSPIPERRALADFSMAYYTCGAPTVTHFLGQGTYPRVRLVRSHQPVNFASIAFVVGKTVANCSRRSMPPVPSCSPTAL